MAITLIKKKDEEGIFRNMMFKTEHIHVNKEELLGDSLEDVDMLEVLVAKVSLVNDELEPLTKPTMYQVDTKEEEFHTKLRLEASKKNQLITSHCTTPEWSPENYINNLEDYES